MRLKHHLTILPLLCVISLAGCVSNAGYTDAQIAQAKIDTNVDCVSLSTNGLRNEMTDACLRKRFDAQILLGNVELANDNLGGHTAEDYLNHPGLWRAMNYDDSFLYRDYTTYKR